MESLNGIKILRQDLKEEGGKYLFFNALESLRKKANISPKIDLTDQLFTKYDSLLITPDDELMGEKDEKAEFLEKIPEAYLSAQQMFVSG